MKALVHYQHFRMVACKIAQFLEWNLNMFQKVLPQRGLPAVLFDEFRFHATVIQPALNVFAYPSGERHIFSNCVIWNSKLFNDKIPVLIHPSESKKLAIIAKYSITQTLSCIIAKHVPKLYFILNSYRVSIFYTPTPAAVSSFILLLRHCRKVMNSPSSFLKKFNWRLLSRKCLCNPVYWWVCLEDNK